MRPRYANKTDGNHSEIVDFLKDNGVAVTDCSKAGTLPDLLTLYSPFRDRTFGRAGFIEVKMLLPGTRYTYKQLHWIAHTEWPVCIATDKVTALLFAKVGDHAVTQTQKDRLAVALGKVTDTKKLWTPTQVQKAMNL